MSLTPVGQVRPSQLLWTYGPGALIDLPNLSVLTMGLDRWQEERCPPIEEARLLAAVRRIVGPQVERLRMPPFSRNEDNDPFSPEARIGVPVRPFPRWLRCVRCGMMAEFDSGLFKLQENPWRPDQTRFVHEHCEKGKNSDAVPSRFLLACRKGHLDDFPWRWYLHQGQGMPDCNGTLAFYEQGASLQTENLWVKCLGCNVSPRSLVHAFGKDGAKYLPTCRGRHPHLGTYDGDCTERPRTVLLGSTNSWFSMSVSVLAIPKAKDELGQLVEDGAAYFDDVENEAEVKVVLKTLIKTSALPGIEKHSASAIWAAIENKRNGVKAEEPDFVTEEDIKRPEWIVLTNPYSPNDWPHFLATPVDVPTDYEAILDSVVLLERLREVNALIGFTRVEAPEESIAPEERAPRASLCKGKPTWVPAAEVHGEGIFLRLKEGELLKWESLSGVAKRDAMLKAGHQGWRIARGLEPTTGYPGIRYAMLHTLSHLLIRELALECGYNAASIRERIYASNGEGDPMAGILLYTAAADSDGTLGGLVELGKPENLGRIMRQALRRSQICSADPLCSEHNAASDRTVHCASCHACGFVAETSCEKGNRYIDRALLVPTFDCLDAAFFARFIEP
jgi:hypothetical protein